VKYNNVTHTDCLIVESLRTGGSAGSQAFAVAPDNRHATAAMTASSDHWLADFSQHEDEGIEKIEH
jgi:hypothetical protein